MLTSPSSRRSGCGPACGCATPRGVERAADDLVADAREVLHPAAAHEHDRVLLQVVPDPGDVRRDLDARREPDTRDLAQRGVRLLRGVRVDARADAPALGRALERRRLRLRPAWSPVPCGRAGRSWARAVIPRNFGAGSSGSSLGLAERAPTEQHSSSGLIPAQLAPSAAGRSGPGHGRAGLLGHAGRGRLGGVRRPGCRPAVYASSAATGRRRRVAQPRRRGRGRRRPRTSRRAAARSRAPRCRCPGSASMPVPAGISLPMITFSLRPEEAVAAALDGRLGEHPRGLLERRRRQPRVGGQRRLRDPHELGATLGRLLAVLDQPPVLVGVAPRRRPSRRAGSSSRPAPTPRPGAASGGRSPRRACRGSTRPAPGTPSAPRRRGTAGSPGCPGSRGSSSGRARPSRRRRAGRRPRLPGRPFTARWAAPRHDVLFLGAVVGHDGDDALALLVLAEAHDARRLGQGGRALGRAGLEQLDDTRAGRG